jgi:hypothetical protein
MQYCVSRAGAASSFTLAWPALANYGVFQGDSRCGAGVSLTADNFYYTTWLDETKAPFTP